MSLRQSSSRKMTCSRSEANLSAQSQPSDVTTTVAKLPKLRSRTGCQICKSRKQKCDGVKPICGYCRLVRQVCAWPPANTLISKQSTTKEHRNEPQPGKSVYTRPNHAIVSDVADLRVAFLLNVMFKGANSESFVGGGTALTIQTELFFAKHVGALSRAFLDAMAMTFWGLSRHDHGALAKGNEMHTDSLQRLRVELGQISEAGDVIAAVSLARILATLIPDSACQWVMHAHGLTTLFQCLGPSRFVSLPMRRLYEKNRWIMITAASAERQPFALDTLQWKFLPWQGAQKDMLQILMDTYSRVPGIHAAWDSGSSEITLKLRTALVELHRWRLLVDEELNESVTDWTQTDTTGPCPWIVAHSFKQVHHAYALAMYNMIVILLARYLLDFPQASAIIHGPATFKTESLAPILLPLGDVTAKAKEAADGIAAVAPWLLHRSRKATGCLYIGGPMHVAHQIWHTCDQRKAEWAMDIIRKIGTKWSSLVLMDLFKIPS